MRENPGTLGLALALQDAGRLVDQLLDLALAASGADRAALLLLEDDGTLECRVLAGAPLSGEARPVSVSGLVRDALAASEPVVVPTTSYRNFPPEWQGSIAAQGAVLAPLAATEGPLGLLLLGWDDARPGERVQATAATAATSLADVLEAAIESEVERRRAFWHDRMLEAGREPVGRALAAIYLRAGLLRLVIEDDIAGDAAEIEALAYEGLQALRRAEDARGDARTISDELYDALVDLTDD